MSSSSIDPKLLQPNPWNTNKVSPDHEAKIDESIKRLGVFKPILVRELAGGTLQIIGGQHRVESAIRLKLKAIPIHNLGHISDKKAQEIGLVDNARYGEDDTLALAQLLEGLGDPEDLATFMPYSSGDFDSIFAASNIALDELDLPEDDGAPPMPAVPKVQTHVLIRFKVPVEDCATITEMVEKTMKAQKFTEEDALSNAGNALVHLLTQRDAP
jgi:hypothetical protein